MDEDDSQSNGSSTDTISSYELSSNKEEDTKKRYHLVSYAIAVASLHTSFYLRMLLYLINSLELIRKRKPKCKRKANVHRDWASVIRFIHSSDDDMFKWQFRLSWEDFYLLESLILDHKCRNGYDYEKHIKYATMSSGSLISLELKL